jgi:hypothetical protein
VTLAVAGTDGVDFPQPPPDDGKAVVVSEFDLSRQPDRPLLRVLFCLSLFFPFQGLASGTGSLCGASFEEPQVPFEEPQPVEPQVLPDKSQVFSDEPHVVPDEPQVLADGSEVLVVDPQVVPDEPQVFSDEVGAGGLVSVVSFCGAGWTLSAVSSFLVEEPHPPPELESFPDEPQPPPPPHLLLVSVVSPAPHPLLVLVVSPAPHP